MRSATFFGKLLILLLAVCPTVIVQAENENAQPVDATTDKDDSASPADAELRRNFVPSEEVSADQEVDFPSDI